MIWQSPVFPELIGMLRPDWVVETILYSLREKLALSVVSIALNPVPAPGVAVAAVQNPRIMSVGFVVVIDVGSGTVETGPVVETFGSNGEDVLAPLIPKTWMFANDQLAGHVAVMVSEDSGDAAIVVQMEMLEPPPVNGLPVRCVQVCDPVSAMVIVPTPPLHPLKTTASMMSPGFTVESAAGSVVPLAAFAALKPSIATAA
jgi:hypothetical protein